MLWKQCSDLIDSITLDEAETDGVLLWICKWPYSFH